MRFPKRAFYLMISLAACAAHCRCDEPAHLDLNIAYCSKYLWRGIPQTSGAVLQPSAALSHKSGLTGSVWCNYDFDSSKITETDYTLAYTYSQPNGRELSFACIHYAFPGSAAANTTELSASTKFGSNPGYDFAVYWDVGKAKGFYASAGAAYRLRLQRVRTEEMHPELSARIGLASSNHNAYWLGVRKSSLNDFSLVLSWPIYADSKVSLTASAAFNTIVSHSLRQGMRRQELDPTNLSATLNVALRL